MVRILYVFTYMYVLYVYAGILYVSTYIIWEIHTYTYVYVQYLHVQSYVQIYTYTYIYYNIHTYTYIYVFQYPYLQYIQIHKLTIHADTIASIPRIRYIRIRTYTDIYIHICTNTIYDVYKRIFDKYTLKYVQIRTILTSKNEYVLLDP